MSVGAPCAMQWATPRVCTSGEELEPRWKIEAIVLSVVLAAIGAFTSFTIITHLRFCTERKWFYVLTLLSGLTLGFQTVWSMHYVGMGALELYAEDESGASWQVEVKYTPTWTVASGICACVLCTIGIALIAPQAWHDLRGGSKRCLFRWIITAGIIVAAGVCGMHYMGMASMSGTFKTEYDTTILALSCLISLPTAITGLTFFFIFPSTLCVRTFASLLISAAVNLTHYTGMKSATYTCTDDIQYSIDSMANPIKCETVAITSLIVNIFIHILGNEYGEKQRRRWAARLHQKHAKQLQDNLDLSQDVVTALVNYDLEAAGSLLQDGLTETDAHTLPLQELLKNLTVYRPFLPHALFGAESRNRENVNPTLAMRLEGQYASQADIDEAVKRLRDPAYNLLSFHFHMVVAFPEMQLYLVGDSTSSGYAGREEYERTLGALYTLFALYRLDIDGKEIISFGVDEAGNALMEATGPQASKKENFYSNMRWDMLEELMARAGLLVPSDDGMKLIVKRDRAVAMLTLTAIHDIMKNHSILPRVQAQHAPYHGFHENDAVVDHDLALAYVLEHYPGLLPSFSCLKPAQRAPVLFTQAKMNFNNGWLVQGEAPPGLLLRTFKQAIEHGGVSQSDVSFYFIHWITDLAGAEPFSGEAWPGAMKLTTKLPYHVFVAFLNSFRFVERLASSSEVQVLEAYLRSRFDELGLRNRVSAGGNSGKIAVMRLALMAQGFEQEMVHAFEDLPDEHKSVLIEELTRTGCSEQFACSSSGHRAQPKGPALLLYYAPALVQKAGAGEVTECLIILSTIFSAARAIFPLEERLVEQTCIIHLDAMKSMLPSSIGSQGWALRRTGTGTAEVVQVDRLLQASSNPTLIGNLGNAPQTVSVTIPFFLDL